MKSQDIERYRFNYKHSRLDFDVFFFIDETPSFLLLFGVQGYALSFAFRVEKGFRVDPFLNPAVYRELCELLGLEYDPNNPFSPRAFLEDFDSEIPQSAQLRNRAQPQEIAVYRRDVEEADRIYFWGWLDNNLRGNHVTPENLEKTKLLLGWRAYDACSRKNISSRWTDRREVAVEFTLPN